MNPFKSYCIKFPASVLMAFACLMMLSACSKHSDKRADLLDCVSNEAVAVIAFDPAAYIESAGGEVKDDQFTMPAALDDIMRKGMSKRERREIETLLEMRGINLHSVLMYVYNDDNDRSQPAFLFYVTDAEALGKWLEDNKFEQDKAGDFICYSIDDKYDPLPIVIDGDIAYLLPIADDIDEAVDQVKEFKRQADSKPLDSWKKDYLCESGKAVAGLIFMDAIDDNDIDEFYSVKEINDKATVFGFDMKLDGVHLQAAIHSFDKDGKPCDLVSDDDITSLNPDLLSYFPAEYCLYGAMTTEGALFDEVKAEVFRTFNSQLMENLMSSRVSDYDRIDYDSYYGYYQWVNPMRDALDSLVSSNDFASSSNEINALALGFGFDKGAKFNFNHPEKMLGQMSTRLVVQFNNDNAATNYYKNWNSCGLPGMVSDPQILTFKPYSMDGEEMFMMRKSSDIIWSTEKSFNTTSHTFPCKLDEAVAFASLSLPVDGALIKALPIKLDFGMNAWAMVSRNSALLDVTLTDAKGGFIENLLELTRKVVNLVQSDYDSYDDEDYPEVEVAEEVWVEDTDSTAYADWEYVEAQ